MSKKALEFNVSTWVSFDVKQKIYEIAHQNNTTVSSVVRAIIEKGVNEYGR